MNWIEAIDTFLMTTGLNLLISSFTVSLLIASIIGSLLYLLWFGVAFALRELGQVEFAFQILGWGIVVFLLPFAHPVMEALEMRFLVWHGNFGRPSTIMGYVEEIFFFFWAAGVLFQLFRHFRQLRKERIMIRSQIPCRKEENESFSAICRNLGITTKSVSLGRSYMVVAPVQAGIWRKTVLLPSETMNQEEEKVCFFHELTHVKQKALLLKRLALWARMIHFYNPLIWMISRRIGEWSEYACDNKASHAFGSASGYMNTLYELRNRFTENASPYTIGLFEKKSDFRKRVDCMKKNRRKGKHAGLVLLLCLVLVVGSTTVVLASGYQIGYWYGQLFRATVIDIEEPYEPPVFEEYEDIVGVDAEVFPVGEVEEVVEGVTSSGSINWSLSAGEGLRTGEFYVAAGSTITVIIGSMSGNTIRVGIYRPNNTRTYVEGSTVNHAFSVTMSGSYSVFVENISSSNTSVTGSYYTY